MMVNEVGDASVFSRTAHGVLQHLAASTGLPTWVLARTGGVIGQVLAVVDQSGTLQVHAAVGHDVGDGSAARITVAVDLPDGESFGELVGFGPALVGLAELQSARAQAAVLATSLGALAQATRALVRIGRNDAPTGAPDPLTGLATRMDWEARLVLDESYCTEFGENAGVLVIELDELKRFNELHGHSAGDEQLRKAGEIVRAHLGDLHRGARISGDRLGVLMVGVSDEAMAAIERSLRGSFAAAGISVALGVGRRHPDRGLLGAAHDAEAHFDGSRPMPVATVGDTAEATAVMEALELGAIMAYYQPIVELRTGRVVAVEALARWQTRDGVREPERFLRSVQQAGLLGALFERVLDDGLRQVAEHRHLLPSLGVAVNFEFDSHLDNTFQRTVSTLLQKHRVPAASLSIELSERQTFELPSAIRRELLAVADMGVRLVLDDFGTGFASLETITTLPVAGVKLDRRFTSQVVNGDREAAVVKAMVALAADAGLEVIAEGIETQAQCDRLVRMGCRLGQGYLFALPQPADALAAVLSAPLVTNF
ncbi:MAG: GGDEF domain-containing phosphodiesterase [Acidobacteria bacterium]|nr:GGDEF domain-containing phosphodiesterase [Acidobacteriota bacterium]